MAAMATQLQDLDGKLGTFENVVNTRLAKLEELIDAEHTGSSLEDRICTIEEAVGLKD